jgi:SAM-dependent methyltransferase
MARNPFQPSRLALVYNSTYIIRRGLFKAISNKAREITGDVLDLGCGSKPYEDLFTAATSYTGCDIQTSGHDHRSSKIDVYYDGKTLPFGDSTFDALVSFETFEHVFNLGEIMLEVTRVLKPGGRLLVTTPFGWDEHEKPFDFARYTSFGMASILRSNGFEIVAIEKTNTYLLATWQLMVAYLTQHAFPRNRILSRMLQVLVIFPLTCVFYGLNWLLPKNQDFFSNLVVLARKA